jgi:hypothetical protein
LACADLIQLVAGGASLHSISAARSRISRRCVHLT